MRHPMNGKMTKQIITPGAIWNLLRKGKINYILLKHKMFDEWQTRKLVSLLGQYYFAHGRGN
jgi:hypothetical protein